MKKLTAFLSKDPLQTLGIILIIISATVLAANNQLADRNNFGVFFINYFISGGYLLAVFIHNFNHHKWRLSHGKIQYTAILLVLWFVSAFALNLEMNVFDSSVSWLSVWIVLSGITIVLATWHRSMPQAVNCIIYFFLGCALLLFSYYAVYLVPLYLISIFGIIAIGISLHTYVPLCLAITAVVLIFKASGQNRALRNSAMAGITLPLLFAVYYMVSWGIANKKINLLLNQSSLSETKVPAWVYVCQHMEQSALTERILKVGLVYHEVTDGNIFWGGLPSKSFDEPKQHDPLITLATLLFQKPNLDETERINILRSIYNSRHQAQERLWSGDQLKTISIINNVKLLPQYRMAYTEKTLTVRNNAVKGWSPGEAIYTFHLSEGSVVSSLSLWINGHEDKSRLTTKAKADSAYHQVVGVENRDPSVVHWQEGNTVSVRVFPCTAAENRKFKIGITSPLRKQGDQLVYENAFFEGPDATNASETMQVTYDGDITTLQLPPAFKQVTPGVYRADRRFQPGWEISLKAPALTETGFNFSGNSYKITSYKKAYNAFTPDKIYLDLNNSWSKAEFDRVWNAISANKVYVYADKLIQLTASNREQIFDMLSVQNFSLFPVSEIPNPDSALLISKSNGNSPNLNDLDESELAKDLTAYLITPRHIRFYNIGQGLTPYLKALKEFRVLIYDGGTVNDLAVLLNNRRFVQSQENDRTVVIENAGMMIQKTDDVSSQTAPDHLLRLFAYNDIMKKVGTSFFKNDYVQPGLIAEATQAYIVSPVSSAIVLETKQDYDRFGIDENKDSLKNASMKSSGAVPEPHEWALILMAVAVVGYVLHNKKILKQTSSTC